MFGDRVRRISGNMHHMDLAESGAHIHVVVSGGTQRDQLYPAFIQLIYDLRAYRVVNENADRVASFGQRSCVFIQFRFQKTKLDIMQPAVTLKRRSVIFFRIKKRCSDHPRSLMGSSVSFLFAYYWYYIAFSPRIQELLQNFPLLF